MTHPKFVPDHVAEALHVHVGNWNEMPLPKGTRDLVDGSGFTLSFVGTENPQQLLGEDPLRTRAWVWADTANGVIGTKLQLTGQGVIVIPASGTLSATRLPANQPVELDCQTEVWAGTTAGGVHIGVWVERRTQGGIR